MYIVKMWVKKEIKNYLLAITNLPFPSGKRTFFSRAKVDLSTIAGLVFGMTRSVVMPPASAAAVPEAKSSLWVAPGSLRWTWTSIKPSKKESFITHEE